MKETCFDAADDLIIVRGRIWGPGSGPPKVLRLAIDTGATHSLVVPEIVDVLGYNPRDGEAITTVRAAIGKEQGYVLRLDRFEALGFAIPDYRIHVFELAEGFGIDGLIGLSFLRQFNYLVRSREGRMLVERAA